MSTPSPAKSPKSTPPAPVVATIQPRCLRCGGAIETAHPILWQRPNQVLCIDCAFEDFPHTD